MLIEFAGPLKDFKDSDGWLAFVEAPINAFSAFFFLLSVNNHHTILERRVVATKDGTSLYLEASYWYGRNRISLCVHEGLR